MQSVPREWLDFLRQQFPKDSRIQLTEIGGNPRPISPGSTGKLDYIDDAGQFHVKWDNGCTLALVLGEDRFSVYLPEPQTFKLYMPLTADFYGRDEWGDMSEDGEEWDGHTLMDYEGQILSALVKNRVPEENESGLMRWYGEDDSVDHKVRSAVFTVEVRNRQLWGVAECRVAGELTPEELTILKEYLGGQASDGWGEGFEQRPIEVDGGELYVHLWQPDDWSIQTEQERFAPKVAEGLPELCFSTLRTTGQLICIKRGETGYYPSDWDTGDKEGNVELADELNEDLGVTPIQRQAIIADKAKTEHPLLILRRRYQKEDHVPTQVITLIVVGAIMFLVIGGLAFLSHYYTLDGIKSKTVGDGQHGTARWATKQEIRQTYAHVPFEPELWRKGEHLPEKQGLVLGCEGPKDHVTALVDTDDIHAMVTAASGAGKTAFFLYPNIEYALASGMSFLCTDTKGDLFRNYAGIAKDCYGYQIAVLDLRNPTRSDGNNLLHLINKYMDIYKADPKNLAAKAKAEKYSKILAKTLINTSGGDSAQYGQNAFFYDSAEGLLTAMFLLVAEYLPTEDADGNPIEKRHIVSVFKLVQELLAPSRVKGKNQFQLLLEKLPPNHKARWFAGSALNTAEQAMASVISTVLSRLNAFLDSEMEQILCFDTAIDAEKFCNEKSAIFIVLPEEDQTKYFMVSLILQNLYREILTVADENGGRLKNRVVFFADELGTCPPIQSLELMFSASRSRGLMLVPIVQSITGQLQKNYGKEGSEIIVDNCQVNLYGGFAPASQTAVELSKSLGSRTVMSGSISRGKNDPSQSLQMMERPLMTPDELKSMPKGSFIVAKTGVHPMKVKLRLFLDWGIRFGMPYEVPEKAQRFVAYADKQELEESIIRRHYGTIVMDSEQPQGGGTSAGGMAQGIQAAPDSRKTVFRP